MIDPTLEPPCRLASEKYRVRRFCPAATYHKNSRFAPGRGVGLGPTIRVTGPWNTSNITPLLVSHWWSHGHGVVHLLPKRGIVVQRYVVRLSLDLVAQMDRNLFDSDLEPRTRKNLLNRRCFDYGPLSGHYSKKMQDTVAASAVGWNAA